MGLEIRRVPPNWAHPVQGVSRVGMTAYQPQHDKSFEVAISSWLATLDRFRADAITEDEREAYPRGLLDWLADEPSPDPAFYRSYRDEEATWVQVYETVTEGTPVTPPFATEGELIEYLVAHGTWADEYAVRAGWESGPLGWSRAAAEGLVRSGMAPSLLMTPEGVFTARAPLPQEEER